MTRPTAAGLSAPVLPGAAFLRISGWSAIGFATIILLTNVLILVPAGMPTTGADAGEVREFFRSAPDLVALSSVFLPTAWILATMFGAGIVTAAGRHPGGRAAAWSLVGFAGLLLQNASFTAVTGIRLGLAESVIDDDAVAGLWALHEALFTLNGTFLALALIGLSLSGACTGLIPVWLSRLGLLASALQFASASLTPLVMEHGGLLGLIGLAGWLLWVAWLLLYGTHLIRHRHDTAIDGGNTRGRGTT